MLENSFYCGIITYGKSYVGNYLDHKRAENHGELEQRQVKGTHTPIVTEEEFMRAQKIRASRRLDLDPGIKKHPLGCRLTHTQLLGDLMYCRCGAAVHVTTSGPTEPYSKAYRCIGADKHYWMKNNKPRKSFPECDNGSVQISTLTAALNYLFAQRMTEDVFQEGVAEKLITKNERLGEITLSADEKEAEIRSACELLKKIHEECRKQNISDESLRRIIEKIVYYRNEISVCIGYNKHSFPLFQFSYEQKAYLKLLREVVFERELTKEDLRQSYFPEPEERHNWKPMIVKLII